MNEKIEGAFDCYKKDMNTKLTALLNNLQVTVEDAARDNAVDALHEIRDEIYDMEEQAFQMPQTDYTAYAYLRDCVDLIDRKIKEYEDG